MSTDSTELTFVRCPSCRSLVPAVSTRCRMCGASLESGDELTEEESQEPASNRVRQRTMSKPKSQLSSAVNKLREEFDAIDSSEEEDAIASADQSSAEVGGDDDFEDPLSDYIDEVEATSTGAVVEEPDSEPDKVEVDSSVEEIEDEMEPEVEELNPHQNLENGSSKREEPAGKPKVIIETGAKRAGGLSFGRSKGQQPNKKEPPQASKPAEDKQQATQTRPAEPQKQRSREDRPSREEKRARPSNESSVSQDRTARGDRAKERQDAKVEPDRDRRSATSKGDAQNESRQAKSAGRDRSEDSRVPGPAKNATMTKHVDHDGRLFGWLVSYSNPEGEAIELREGKFFVTSSSLKETDLVIDDDSVSTPHAVITVSAERGLQVQDLMSEGGVFVRQRENDVYRREEEIVEVDHGDWVRFGDVEFLISLIAHVGKK